MQTTSGKENASAGNRGADHESSIAIVAAPGQDGNLEAALSYAGRGWRVLPLCWPTKDGKCGCSSGHTGRDVGKAPLGKAAPHGAKDATTNAATIRKWWGKWPRANVGIATGDGLAVLDADGPEGQESLRGKHLPLTQTVQTPGGGTHRYYRTEGQVRSPVRFLPGLDLRGEGGYVVAPLSRHVNGGTYEFVDGMGPDVGLADMPQWITEAAQTKPKAPSQNGKPITEGRRNAELTRIAGRYRKAGLDPDALEGALQAVNRKRCTPPLAAGEVAKIAASVGRYPSGDGKPEFVPETITADLLDRMVLPEPKWAVEGLLPEGATVLAGRPKIGKSWLALGLAVAVASGEAYFGAKVTGGDVLYLALEDTPRRLQSRLRVLGKKPDRLTLATMWANVDDGGLDALDKWLTDHPHARLVLVDTFQRIRARRGPNADLYGTDYVAMSALKTLADKHAVALLVLHHTRKAEALDPLDAVSGTTGLTGAADTVMVLSRARGEADGKLALAGRDVGETELALRFTEGAWELLGDAREFAVSESRRKVLDLLREAGSMGPKAISEGLGMKLGTLKRLLHRMVLDGVLGSEGGKYQVTDVHHVPDVHHVHHVHHVPPTGKGTSGIHAPQTMCTLENADRDGDKGPEYTRCTLGTSGTPEDPTDWPTCCDCGRRVPQVSETGFCADCGGAA